MNALRAAALLAATLLAACGGGETPDLAERGDAHHHGPPPLSAGWTVLDVDGVPARIWRDDYGTPHVFAETDRALFVGYGWAVAQDRLFQLELNRRAARGTLSALFGPSQLNADRYARTVGYTDAELDLMYAAMPAGERGIYDAYAEGINRYVAEVVATDPSKVPFEFLVLGALPEPWTTRDSMAFGAFMVRRFGEIGGRELRNLELWNALVTAHGAAAEGMFDDLRWLDDPDAPVTVPRLAYGPRQHPWRRGGGGGVERQVDRDEAKELWAPLGVPTKLGSYAWVISAARSAERAPLLYGGPQMGFSAPEVLHEVQLTGGSGFHVKGMAFAGAPAVLIGRNAHVAWTSTTATGDNLDVYAETPCDAGAGPGTGTVYRGGCAPLQVRTETIAVRGGAPVALTVARSVHGPVTATGPGGVLFAEKRAHWLRELETGSAFFAFDRAHNLNQFRAAARRIVTSHNFLYVDKVGNIAYWQAGQVPVRPDGFDPRLPFPGDGSAEWTGALVPMPESVNPPRGWLANWNNKPATWYPNSDEGLYGKQGRLREIDRLLAGDRRVTLDDMRAIPMDIARVKGNGREARFVLPYLLEALADVPPAHPSAAAAKAVLEGWDGSAFEDAVTSTTLLAGEVIFETWLSRAMARTFADELGARANEATPNVLLHSCDFVETGTSGVPPSRDWWNGAGWRAVFSAAFDEAVTALAAGQGPDPAAWTAPRGTTVFRHPVIGPVASIPTSNRSTYAQIVVAGRQGLSGESIFTLGQSGFLGFAPPATPVPDAHFADQLPLYTAFQYKPQVLWRNPPSP